MEIIDGVYFGGISVMVNTTGCGPVNMSSILVFHPIALVAEQADVRVLETRAERRVSSNLTEGTIFPRVVMDSISIYEIDGKSSILFEEA